MDSVRPPFPAHVRHCAESGSRQGRTSHLGRWSATGLLAVGIGFGVGVPQTAGAQTPPTAPASSTPAERAPATTAPVGSESTVLTQGACAVEVVVEVGALPPSSTLPGTCLLSAASGVFAESPAAPASAADPLPATGSSTGTAGALAAAAVVAGAALWFVARRPRAT